MPLRIIWKSATYQQNECAICLNTISYWSSIKTICGHTFHRKCLNTWKTQFQYGSRCPNCNTSLDTIKPITPTSDIMPSQIIPYPTLITSTTHNKYSPSNNSIDNRTTTTIFDANISKRVKNGLNALLVLVLIGLCYYIYIRTLNLIITDIEPIKTEIQSNNATLICVTQSQLSRLSNCISTNIGISVFGLILCVPAVCLIYSYTRCAMTYIFTYLFINVLNYLVNYISLDYELFKQCTNNNVFDSLKFNFMLSSIVYLSLLILYLLYISVILYKLKTMQLRVNQVANFV